MEALPRERQAGSVLAAPDFACRFGAVEDAVQVGRDNLVVVRSLAVDHTPLGPRYASISNKNVQTAVEFFRDAVDAVPDVLFVRHVDLVGAAFDAKVLFDVCGAVQGFFVAVVPDCYVCTCFG